MVAPAPSLDKPSLDKREPRGIIIRAGTPRRAGAPFWAYAWSEDTEAKACAGPRREGILEAAGLLDLSTPECRASP